MISRFGRIRHRTKVAASILAAVVRILVVRCRVALSAVRNSVVGIFLIEHLGDIVACEPVARYLRKEHPDAHLIWFVRPPYRGLLESNPAIDTVVSIHCLTVKNIVKQLPIFSQTIDLHFPERYCALCYPTTPAAEHHGGITIGNFYSQGNILQTFSRSAGLPSLNDPPRLWIGDDAMRVVKSLRLPGKYIVIHCTSNAEEKEWGHKNWRRLVAMLFSSTDFAVAEIGDRTVVGETDSTRYRNLCGTLTITQSAQVIRGAALFIGIDSGPAHMANAAGVPGVVMMGRYLGFAKYNPFGGGYSDGSNASLIQYDGMVCDLPFDRVCDVVLQAVEKVKGKYDGRYK